MLLAAQNILEHVLDRPWPGCQVELFGMRFTFMSGAILSILMVGILLPVLLIPMARRAKLVPGVGQSFLESIVLFVRDWVALPSLRDRAYDYLPFLTTVFVFIFGLNIMGLIPLDVINRIFGIHDYKIGGAATAMAYVSGSMALVALLLILVTGLYRSAEVTHHHRHWPLWLCIVLAPVLWFLRLAPPIPGLGGKIALLPMATLELASALAKCAALMVRLCANMVAGHALLAVLLMFAIQGLEGLIRATAFHGIYIWPVCVASSIVLNLMEVLVAGIQAFIFTIMTALFLGMYAEANH